MPIILIHSSKTMQSRLINTGVPQQPLLIEKAASLADYIQGLTVSQIEKIMQVSPSLAIKTQALMKGWSSKPDRSSAAIDAFLGDIYSGLQVPSLSNDDREYANTHLFILSGLYGVLRALDSIVPYRLEMGYRFPDSQFKNLYKFWDDSIARSLPDDQLVINLSAAEYTRAVLPYLADRTVISPKFMTINPKTGKPTFVVVHAKIARGAFARWLIKQKITSESTLQTFSDLNYRYEASLSTPDEPVFVCERFGGLGLSVRLTK